MNRDGTVNIKKAVLDMLIDCSRHYDYWDRDYEEELLLELTRLGLGQIWYRVYPNRFFKTKEEAEAHFTDDYADFIRGVYSQKEKDELISELKRYKIITRQCKKCGYTSISTHYNTMYHLHTFMWDICIKCFREKGIKHKDFIYFGKKLGKRYA